MNRAEIRLAATYHGVLIPEPRSRWAALALAGSVAALAAYGIGRSLWLDEVWVANSVSEPSLAEMFDYPRWLQVSPPLFLLLARGSAAVFGVSNASLRLVPLALAVFAVAAMFFAAVRVVAPRYAVMVTALLAFQPTVVEFSRTFKQYSGEIAASTAVLLALIVYLQNPSPRRFWLLLAAVALALPLAYPVVLLMPGVVMAVYLAGTRRRAAGLALVAGAEFLFLYSTFIRPNVSPHLRAFWAADRDTGFSPGIIAALVFCAVALIRRLPSWRYGTAVACALPPLLLAASGAMGWYPVSARTRLFVLPGFLLVAAMYTEELLRRWPRRLAVNVAIAAVIVAVAIPDISKVYFEDRGRPVEDIQGAVDFLRTHVQPGDLVLVHSEVREGVLFYAPRQGWSKPKVVFGDTGWPCCPRDKEAWPHFSTPDAVIRDLDSKIPRGFRGRIWLLYSTRPTHWQYTGLDEGDLWRRHVWESGCPPGPYFDFQNLAVSPMDCSGAGYTVGEPRR